MKKGYCKHSLIITIPSKRVCNFCNKEFVNEPTEKQEEYTDEEVSQIIETAVKKIVATEKPMEETKHKKLINILKKAEIQFAKDWEEDFDLEMMGALVVHVYETKQYEDIKKFIKKLLDEQKKQCAARLALRTSNYEQREMIGVSKTKSEPSKAVTELREYKQKLIKRLAEKKRKHNKRFMNKKEHDLLFMNGCIECEVLDEVEAVIKEV